MVLDARDTAVNRTGKVLIQKVKQFLLPATLKWMRWLRFSNFHYKFDLLKFELLTGGWELCTKEQNEFIWKSEIDECKRKRLPCSIFDGRKTESCNFGWMRRWSIPAMFPLGCGISKNSCQDIIKHFKYPFSRKGGKKLSQSAHTHTQISCIFRCILGKLLRQPTTTSIHAPCKSKITI